MARWLSRRRALEAAESAAADPLSASPESAALAAEANRKKLLEDEAKAQAAVPSKFVSELIEIVLACRIAFVEMSGLNDGRALKTLIPQLHPRRLIMVNGDAPTRADMRSVLQAIKTLTHDVHAPAWMQHVQIGEVTNAYTLTLGEGLLAQLEMSRFEEFEVAHVRALVKAAGDAVAGAPVLETEASLAEDAEEGSEQVQARALMELADEHVLRSVVHDTTEAEAEAKPRLRPMATLSRQAIGPHWRWFSAACMPDGWTRPRPHRQPSCRERFLLATSSCRRSSRRWPRRPSACRPNLRARACLCVRPPLPPHPTLSPCRNTQRARS